MDRLAGEHELALRLGQHAMADQVTGGDAGRPFDVVVETVDRHGELVGIECELPLGLEVLLDAACAAPARSRRSARAPPWQCPPGPGRRQAARLRPRPTPAARAWRFGNRRAPGTPPRSVRRRGVTAARAPVRRASPPGRSASALSRASASPRRSPMPSATSSVKVITQPLVASGRKRKPCATVAGTRIAQGAANGTAAASNVMSPPPCSISRIWKRLRWRCARMTQSWIARTRRDGFDMDEVERLIVRRIAVEMKQRERGRAHDETIGQSAGGENLCTRRQTARDRRVSHRKKSPADGRGSEVGQRF